MANANRHGHCAKFRESLSAQIKNRPPSIVLDLKAHELCGQFSPGRPGGLYEGREALRGRLISCNLSVPAHSAQAVPTGYALLKLPRDLNQLLNNPTAGLSPTRLCGRAPDEKM